VAGTPSAAAGALQHARALLLERAAAAHLGLDPGELGEYAVDVARADRGALLEHEREQPARGRELGVEVREQLGLEHRAHARSFRAR
jgi:hypothetical protein